MNDGDLDLSGFTASPERKVDVPPPAQAAKPKKTKKAPKSGGKAEQLRGSKPPDLAPEPASRQEAAPTQRQPLRSGRKQRVNVSLPVELSIRFTDTATREDRYLTDLVLDAYRDHFAELRSDVQAQRGEMDLPFRPRRRKIVSGRVTHMLYLAAPEIAVIDASAAEVGISRSELVAMLLDRELA